MKLFISTACDETRTFGEDTLVRSIIEEKYRQFSYNISLIMKGWEVWKRQVSQDLCVHGLDRERIYEVIVEWSLDEGNLLSLISALTLPDMHIAIVEKNGNMAITVYCHYIPYHRMTFCEGDEGELMITYYDLITGGTRERYVDMDDLLTYTPSFS